MQHISLDRRQAGLQLTRNFSAQRKGVVGISMLLSLYIVHVGTVNTEHPRKNENKKTKGGTENEKIY